MMWVYIAWPVGGEKKKVAFRYYSPWYGPATEAGICCFFLDSCFRRNDTALTHPNPLPPGERGISGTTNLAVHSAKMLRRI